MQQPYSSSAASGSASSAQKPAATQPWYRHPWPWLLMLGPVLVILAGIHTTWLAFSQQDALVVDDYYKQGKAINQDLRRDQVAATMNLQMQLRYDAADGMLQGEIRGQDIRAGQAMVLKMIHSTQPEKDMRFTMQPDAQGRFSIALPMLELARWQVQVEGMTDAENRDGAWRLHGEWKWPQQRNIAITAG